jgi:hypothetical protein
MNNLNVEHGRRNQTVYLPEASYPVADGELTVSPRNSLKYKNSTLTKTITLFLNDGYTLNQSGDSNLRLYARLAVEQPLP